MGLSLIQSKIYEIRSQKVMLDFDLAEIYQVQTKTLKQSIKRNLKRFPQDFMFELTKSEWKEVVTNCDHIPENMKYSYVMPFAFTEHGVTMLSSVLRSEIAVSISIQIVRAFIAVRNLILYPPVDTFGKLEKEMKELKQYIEEVFTDYNDINEDTRMQLELINETLAKLQSENTSKRKDIPPVGYLVVKQKQESTKE